MLATASAQVCVPLGHSSLYFISMSFLDEKNVQFYAKISTDFHKIRQKDGHSGAAGEHVIFGGISDHVTLGS